MLTLWFGKSLLGLTDLKRIAVTGSGDTTYDYVLIPVKLILTLLFSLAAIRWLSDEKRYSDFVVDVSLDLQQMFSKI